MTLADESFSALLTRVTSHHQPTQPRSWNPDCMCGWQQPRLSFWRRLIDCREGPCSRHVDHVLDEVGREIDRLWPRIEAL